VREKGRGQEAGASRNHANPRAISDAAASVSRCRRPVREIPQRWVARHVTKSIVIGPLSGTADGLGQSLRTYSIDLVPPEKFTK
jgi:hypothetical protein